MSAILFIAFLVIAFGVTAASAHYEKKRKENPKDVYKYRELPPEMVHSVRNRIQHLRDEVKANGGEFTDSQIRELNQLRGELRLEESHVAFEVAESLRVQPATISSERLQLKDWKMYLHEQIKTIMHSEMPYRNVA